MAAEERLLVDDEEVVITPNMGVRCDGGNSVLGHPAEFISLSNGGRAICNYCGRHYVHTSNPDAERLRAAGRPFVA